MWPWSINSSFQEHNDPDQQIQKGNNLKERSDH
jgi:hypothetical protein